MEVEDLERAEEYVASLEDGHERVLLMLAAFRERFLEIMRGRDMAVSALAVKKTQYAASLQSVKLVSARMIQEREAFILSIAKQTNK
jgi:hypothetical protein